MMDSLVMKYEDKMFNEIDFVEKKALELYKQDQKNLKAGNKTELCRNYLTDYSTDFARILIDRWWEIGDELWVKMRWKF